MTSQKDQIQALITEIDGVLQKTTPRLPWVVSGEMTQQRQVLERVRNYLVALQRRQIAGEGFGQAGARPDLLAHDIYYQPAQPYPSPQAESSSGQPLYGQDELNAQQMLQAIVHEMGYLRTNLMQPLQADLEVLRQQRETLVHEIRQLESQRQGYGGQLPGQQQLIAEFLQALMSRLQETLPQQLAQTLSSNQQALPYANPYANNLALAGSAPSVIATSSAPSQGLGNIQVSQAPADELLIRLDSTLSVVFESLQRNVQSYQESLAQGLDKMHSMGQQGEMMFTALISHLAEQLGRETSAYLQPSAPTDRESARSSPAIVAPTSVPLPPQPPTPTVNPSLFSPSAAADSLLPFTLPFPGTEVADHFASADTPASTNMPAPSVDLAIDSWLRAAASAPSDVDLEIAALNLEGFDLSQLAAQDVNALLELDATLLGTNLPSQPLLAPTAPSDVTTVPDATAVEDTADIDAALKLLEQLSSELQEQPSSVADADAEIDRMLSSPTALAGDVSTIGIPDDARDELDEFYESLFGADAIGAAIATPTQVAASATETAPQPIIAPEVAIAPADQPETQPISTLPAETQMPTGAIAAIDFAPPSAATVTDPTLGWHLPTAAESAPLVASPAAEPEIPEALLEDELLGGWDFADAEVDLSEPVATPTTADLLGGWDLAPTDRAALPFDVPPAPATDTVSATDALPAIDPLAAFFDESQPLATDGSQDILPFVAAPADDRSETSQDESRDEISSLTDLFGEPAFGEPAIDEAPPGSAIAEAPALDQPLFNLSASLPDLASDTSSAQIPTADLAPANLTDGYLTDDRYAPASPDEDLLPLDEPIEALDSELWLDETTLNRLSEDLFNLEESIDEPATQLYSREPDADSQALVADTATFADTFTDAMAQSEPVPTASETTTLGDWGDASLDDFAFNEVAPDEAAPGEAAAVLPTTPPVLFPLESESRAIAADPPGTFILEGMDDLFANTPVAPPVTPILPPVAPTVGPSVPFALEGMDDLFADILVSDQAVADSMPAELPFTLEGVDELFADDPVSPSSLPSVSPSAAELPFTLEGVDELFADDPAVGTGTLPSALTPATDPPLSFTLEGVDELFADLPLVIATPPVPDASPPILPVADGLADEPSATLLFGETASPAPIQPDPVAAFTLEQVGNLFVELPAAASSARDDGSETTIASTPNLPGDAASPAPFTFEQVGDLFIEVPSEASTLDEQAAALTALLEPAPFALEQVGNLVVETIAETTPAAPAEAPLPTPQSAASEPSALEQAFASLMGAFDEQDASPEGTEATEATTQAPEKKKEMS